MRSEVEEVCSKLLNDTIQTPSYILKYRTFDFSVTYTRIVASSRNYRNVLPFLIKRSTKKTVMYGDSQV